ncbi:MAG: c-type cytochrome, partial [Gammaproteobacteria bacterium]
MERGTETTQKVLLAYKARPLNGIWATPPNLHNGSVANLYELMLPAESSSPTFNLVSW